MGKTYSMHEVTNICRMLIIKPKRLREGRRTGITLKWYFKE
jgi:hypothetical protein